jgi:hypothetical protein
VRMCVCVFACAKVCALLSGNRVHECVHVFVNVC